MTALMIITTAVLLAVGGIHALWGMGIWFPIRDERTLAQATVGARGVERMPGPIPCFLVAGGLTAVAVAVWLPDGLIRGTVLWPAAAILFLRGLMAYAPFWRKMTPEEPFATYDRTRYGPLCLALGAGLFLILQKGP